jgi:hypothetical protein
MDNPIKVETDCKNGIILIGGLATCKDEIPKKKDP